MLAGAGMQEAIRGFGHPETFTSSHQRDNCRLTANAFLPLLIVQDAALLVCLCGCVVKPGVMFNSADSGLLEKKKNGGGGE